MLVCASITKDKRVFLFLLGPSWAAGYLLQQQSRSEQTISEALTLVTELDSQGTSCCFLS